MWARQLQKTRNDSVTVVEADGDIADGPQGDALDTTPAVNRSCQRAWLSIEPECTEAQSTPHPWRLVSDEDGQRARGESGVRSPLLYDDHIVRIVPASLRCRPRQVGLGVAAAAVFFCRDNIS